MAVKYPVPVMKEVSTGICLQATDTEGFILSLCYMTYAHMILLKAFENGKFNTSNCCTSHQRPLRSQQPQNGRDSIQFFQAILFLKIKALVSEIFC